MAGAVRFGDDARRHGQSAHIAAVGCLLAEQCTHFGFTCALLVAIPIAIHADRLTAADVLGLAIYVTLTAAQLILAIVAARSRVAIRRLTAFPDNVRTLLAWRRAQPNLRRTTSIHAADELHLANTITIAGRHRQEMRPIAVHPLLWPVLGALLVGSACAAAGVHLGWSEVLITYCLATTFSTIGVLPGGVGFSEVSIGATLHGFGVETTHTIAAIGLFDPWLPMSAGAVTLRRRSSPGAGEGALHEETRSVCR